MANGPDRWFRTILIVAGSNDRFVVREDGINHTMTIPPGRYALYNAATAPDEIADCPYPSLWLEMITQINSTLTENYKWSAAQAAGSTRTDYRAIVLERTSGSLTFSLLTSSGSWTLDKRLMGIASDSTSDIPQSGSTTAAQGQSWGQYISPRHAAFKPGNQFRKVEDSTEDIASDAHYSMVWRKRRKRVVQYKNVPAGFIYTARAKQQDYADTMGVALDDTRGAFEHIWEDLSESHAIVIVHDVGDQASAFDDIQSHSEQIEVVKRLNKELAEDFESMVQLTAPGGERYDLTIPLVHIGGDYDQ